MKAWKKLVVFLLSLMLCAGMMTTPALAAVTASASQDGLEATITTEKDSYGIKEKISAKVTLKNTNFDPVTNIVVENIIPEGYKLADGIEAKTEIASLAAGKSMTFDVSYVKDKTSDQTENPDIEGGSGNKEDTDSPNMGDNLNIMFYVAVFTATCFSIGVFSVLKKKKNGKRFFSLFLCIVMVGTMLPFSASIVSAADTKSFSVSKNVQAGGKTVTLKAVIKYNSDIYPDKDSDKVPDYIEVYFGTDSTKYDTDGDSLLDYDEIYVLKTDPTKVDTDENGVTDGNEDADKDGLTNAQEINTYKSDPTKIDTDGDSLSDGNEVNIYGTSPTKYDTDSDGLSDGEEILLGLNPLKTSSDGSAPDGKRLFEQELDNSLIDESLKQDNLTVPSVSGNVPGDINIHVTVKETNINALNDNRAVIGKQIKLETDYPEGTDLKLNFTSNDTDERFEFYLICKFVDNEIVPCETTRDGDNISAVVSSGDYVVIDAEKLLIDLDIPITKYKNYSNASASSLMSTVTTEKESTPLSEVSDEQVDENCVNVDKNGKSVNVKASKDSENQKFALANILKKPALKNTMSTAAKSSGISGQADIVFVIDTTGSMSSAINNVVANIDSFVETLSTEYSVKVNFALVNYKDITSNEKTFVVKNGSSNWFSDIAAYRAEINKLYAEGGGDGPETAIDGLATAEALDFRQNANKFVILVTDADYKTDNNFGVSSMDEMTGMLKNAGIVTSVISELGYESIYRNLYTETGGVFGNIRGNFKAILLELAGKIGEIVNDGSWVLLSDYQFIKLDKPLDNSGYSSDNDSLSDIQELGEQTVSNVKPYIDWVMKAYNIPEGMYDDPTTVKVYKYKSNPILTDTDFDGKDDDHDALPKDNNVMGKLYTDYAKSLIDFRMDYRWFFNSNTVYNQELSTVSLLMASAVYGNDLSMSDSISKDKTNGKSMKDVLEYLGFAKAKTVSIKATDEHISEVGLGYRTVEYSGSKKTVLAVIVRGTNGTIKEWSSNFDIGKSSDFSSIEDWKTKDNHKGFDIAANRIMKIVSDYVSENSRADNFNSNNISYWVTGHSRGAAIANIIGAYYEKSGKQAFTYTFAAPNTTLAGNAGSYMTIFNVVNTDDFVPCLPMSAWGYTRYGRTASKSIASSYENKWEELTGIWDYNPDTFGMQDTVSKMAKILSGDPRVECYKYTCKDHGDGSSDNITITNYGTSKDSRESAIAKIPENALPYCKITRYDGWAFAGWNFDVCQTPAYFMQILAAKMSNKISNYRFAVELNIADRYESTKTAIVSSALGGLEHPHYTESYYVLSKNVSNSDF